MSTYSSPCDNNTIGSEMYQLISELYPICRSITGDGFRESLRLLQACIPLKVHEVPSGTQVFDWTVPKEWNIRDAYVKDSTGNKVIDFTNSNLHLVSYSIPFRQKISLAELSAHLYSMPDHPDWIPYRTTYYKEDWGFCVSHKQLKSLENGEYEVYIDSSLKNGYLTYGEYYLQGQTTDEILISCHCCHPSLCNDNLSGIALATFLAKYLSNKNLRYSYRFLFIPGTIGSITWLQLNEDKVANIKHGLVVACVGDSGKLNYKKSRRGDAEVDKAVIYILNQTGQEFEVQDFSPYGYDERQYCSPGFNLPVGSLTRTPHGRYPEYHTSADNLDFIKPDYLADSFDKYLAVFNLLEKNYNYVNTNPKGEPQLGRRGLYSTIGGKRDANRYELAMLWILNYADGKNKLLDIAERSGIEFALISQIAYILEDNGLLKKI